MCQHDLIVQCGALNPLGSQSASMKHEIDGESLDRWFTQMNGVRPARRGYMAVVISPTRHSGIPSEVVVSGH